MIGSPAGRTALAVVTGVLLLSVLAGCASASTEVESLPEGVLVDYQLGGGYPPPDGVTAVVRDSTDMPEPGMYSICYVNAFQTQPADREVWLSDRRDLVLTNASDRPVIDPGWPDELLLDTSTRANRERLAELSLRDLRRCASAGYAAVEFDNLDSFSRSGGRLTADDALDLAALLVSDAHDLGLATAQKNSVELADRARREAEFDFAIVEQCHEFDECASLVPAYGDSVVDIEYSTATEFADACADPDRAPSTIRRDRELATPGSPGYVFEACD